MIIAYHRPKSLAEALELLAEPNTRPLGGGTALPSEDGTFAVVDLQTAGLGKISMHDEKLVIGATVTLNQLRESSHTPAVMRSILKQEAPLNLRNIGTIAGTLVTCDGRSPFATAMLALDAKLTLSRYADIVRSTTINLGDFLPVRADHLPGQLITKIEVTLKADIAYESVARTPADRPIVCVVLVRWPSGRTRLALGGWGRSPILALDGTDAGGIAKAAHNAFSAAADEWASAEYRSETAALLAKRCLEKME